MLVLRDHVLTCLDLGVGVLLAVGLKGRFSDQQSVNNDSKRPNVHFVRMATLSQNFRCDVVGRAAEGVSGFLALS